MARTIAEAFLNLTNKSIETIFDISHNYFSDAIRFDSIPVARFNQFIRRVNYLIIHFDLVENYYLLDTATTYHRHFRYVLNTQTEQTKVFVCVYVWETIIIEDERNENKSRVKKQNCVGNFNIR